MKKGYWIIFLGIFLLIGLNYGTLDGFLVKIFQNEQQTVSVNRIVDGDTIDTSIGKIRLLGINTPEKGEKYSTEAKTFLERQVLNKTVKIEFGKEKKDLYGRYLAYVFSEGKNVNLEIVKAGFANPYFPSGKDNYYSLFFEAWEKCTENYCKKSEDKCGNCIVVKELDKYEQKVIFSNKCNFNCNISNWDVKDEGRKHFIFNNSVIYANSELKLIVENKTDTKTTKYWKRETYVWTSSGDTLFLRDSAGNLVTYEHY